MPAYRERVYIFPAQNGEPGWIVEFPLWWDRRKFLMEYGDRQIDTGNPFYVDNGLLLTVPEALAWDKRSREEFTQDPRSQEPFFIEAMQRWESMMKNASWVVVELYEWESGLE